jgi:hypothetical protein
MFPDPQMPGRMMVRMVEQEHVERGGSGLGKGIQQHLHVVAIQVRQSDEEAIATREAPVPYR